MRTLILSDLHANLEATTAALEHAAGQGYDRVVCLGDIVGYGASPNEVIALLRGLSPQLTIRGNHDKVAAGVEEGEQFNEIALSAARWTRDALSQENREWLRGLPKGPIDAGGFLASHGNPVDEDAYVLGLTDALMNFDMVPFDLAFFGHSHFACAFSLEGDEISLAMFDEDHHRLLLDERCRYLVNPGSIGQPRDHNPKASYAILDQEGGVVTIHRVAYDVAGAQQRIADCGLPLPLAYRLEFGV